MGYGIKIIIEGDYALFSRPEMKVERVSYDVPTPSALVGLISSIYWHPGSSIYYRSYPRSQTDSLCKHKAK
jgi:CRISPR-associated Cas5-like protein